VVVVVVVVVVDCSWRGGCVLDGGGKVGGRGDGVGLVMAVAMVAVRSVCDLDVIRWAGVVMTTGMNGAPLGFRRSNTKVGEGMTSDDTGTGCELRGQSKEAGAKTKGNDERG
jgi:hypothetical protein